ncbi:ABC transporter ATP-binding protein [Allorhodopirellula heiligendammensis]|uniref:Lipoprotein-releasing system ATP-binding protein LolD n=1 Tax=Allorhodopirellula heiligendammensis TaxID=2714739 RepID=A0A5C6B7H0_9BACT|nr:ABC transporter ATP-binding protein [Allorhodopirellula heiligendammensis]TWU07421.1 Lipoprotein-releasing system ATP-binding protein LolD [Allorhodopirellula heiligendammensis]
MLTMNNVSKRYTHRRSDVYALHDANVEIGTGEFLSIVGPSGSGKSTLLLMLGGMLSPTSGQVTLHGTSLYDLSPNERAKMRKQHVGFVFQGFNLVPYLTALENVMIPLFLTNAAQETQESRATELLQRVGLGDRLDHKPAELSIGQQQRVALARMLANDPQLILADEPTGNLDPETSSIVLAFFEQFISEGRTIVMVTHDPRAAERARRKLRIDGGRIIEDAGIKARIVA